MNPKMNPLRDDPRLLAFALDELEGPEREEIAAAVAADPELQALVAEYRGTAATLREELAGEPMPSLTAGQKQALSREIGGSPPAPAAPAAPATPRRRRLPLWIAAAATVAVCAGGLAIVGNSRARFKAEPSDAYGMQRPASPAPCPAGPGESRKSMAPPSRSEKYAPPRPLPPPPSPPSPMASSPAQALAVTVSPSENVPVQSGALPIGSHSRIDENGFLAAAANPFSTFSIDVDTASYSMIRQQLARGYLPHVDSVRIEEMVNYFTYEYPQPDGSAPFSTTVEVAGCPWSPKHRLVRIGLKGREIAVDKRPLSNLVFLLDVSGSMGDANKLGYVKASMAKLVGQLGENDRVAIVVYAGAAGQVLPSTPCDKKRAVLDALERLAAGGSTAGGAGIELAYKVAAENFIKGGVNRVILCTDGDFNVGVTNGNDLERLIEEKAKSGVFLTILGFGMGNYRDNTMEALSNKGNGNYAYIDSLQEAEKVLVRQISGTLMTIAKDVKIQVNFNKHLVSAYRLIGYENRMLRKEDFNDDKKDAGEIGAGHTVTALYEVVPAGVELPGQAAADDDKYSDPPSSETTEANPELLTVRLRYKLPDGDKSLLLETPVVDEGRKYSAASGDFKFAAAVAGFGMILRDSKLKGDSNYDAVLELGAEGVGSDPEGYRKEFLELVKKARGLGRRN